MNTITFEGVNLGSQINIEHLVFKQLQYGTHRGKQDGSPGDWLIRAFYELPSEVQKRISDAVNKALCHSSSDIRVEALRVLSICPEMIQSNFLLELMQNQFELFKGLRRSTESIDIDRGHDFVKLLASQLQGNEAKIFRHHMVFDPTYGESVMASLVKREPDWILEHITELVEPNLDLMGRRLKTVIFRLGLRQDKSRLRILVEKLAKKLPQLRKTIESLLEEYITDKQLRKELMSYFNN